MTVYLQSIITRGEVPREEECLVRRGKEGSGKGKVVEEADGNVSQ